MKPLDVLMPAKGMALIEEQISARLPLHRLWLEPNPDLWLAEWAPRIRAIAMTGGHAPLDEAYMRQYPEARDHLQFRRRLRQYRRQGGGAAWNHRHQYARRARRRSRRHDARPHDHDRAPTAAGGAISARRAMDGEGRFPAQPFAEGPHRRHSGTRAHRQGDRDARQRLRARCRLSRPARPGRCPLSLLFFAHRHGQGFRRSDRGRARRPRDAPHHQRRSA